MRVTIKLISLKYSLVSGFRLVTSVSFPFRKWACVSHLGECSVSKMDARTESMALNIHSSARYISCLHSVAPGNNLLSGTGESGRHHGALEQGTQDHTNSNLQHSIHPSVHLSLSLSLSLLCVSACMRVHS